MDQWTPRVDAKVALVEVLLERDDAWLKASGLKKSDLEKVRDAGKACKAFDREQKSQFAAIKARVTGRSEANSDIAEREDGLRDRLPLVIADLVEAGDVETARWLGNLTYARFRMRELAPDNGDPEPTEAESAELKKVRIQRGDIVSRFDGLDAFTEAIAKRDAVAQKLGERGMDAESLRKLGADAAAEVKLGRNELVRAAASEKEEEQAEKVRTLWATSRRAIRKACASDSELQKKLAAC